MTCWCIMVFFSFDYALWHFELGVSGEDIVVSDV